MCSIESQGNEGSGICDLPMSHDLVPADPEDVRSEELDMLTPALDTEVGKVVDDRSGDLAECDDVIVLAKHPGLSSSLPPGAAYGLCWTKSSAFFRT
jgi:hypothetical protein